MYNPHSQSTVLWTELRKLKQKYIEKDFCICYNANRQKEIKSPCGQKKRIPRLVWQYHLRILLFFYSGKAPTRLVVAFVVTV